MIGENNIPKHWGKTKASEVGKLLRGINYKKEEASSEAKINYLPVLRGNNINGELNFDDLVYVQTKNVSKEQLIKSGDIVFAMSSGSKHLVGKSAKAKADFNGSFGAFCGVFRPNENFDKDFVAYFFQSPYYKKIISEISKGTNINNLKREHILDLDFPIPPLPEQQAIVAKIEELLSELDNGKQQLQTAQQQLKVYRQSLLKWAFEGKLTNKKVKDGELPKGWKSVNVIDIVEKGKHSLKAGPFGSSLKKEFYVQKGYKIYGQEQVIIDDAFFGDYYINEEKYLELKSCRIKPFDILISLVGTVGKVLILPENAQEGVINPRLIKIKCKNTIIKLLSRQLPLKRLFQNTLLQGFCLFQTLADGFFYFITNC